jgi:UDP-N-acetylmuramoyl-L-alanyl-D-glutamate--2,6-diaminopimelate ligase
VKLSDLLDGVVEPLEPFEAPDGAHRLDLDALDVQALAIDHREVTRGALFACIRGTRHDGHDHASEAAERGAIAVLAERRVDVDPPVVQILTRDVRAAVGPLAARLHGNPADEMRVVGITGTNGKTTVAHLVEAVVAATGRRAATIGTLGARWSEDRRVTGFTTPEAPALQAMLATMRDDGVDTVAMEVSSHALDQRRVDGVRFAVAAFTNLSPEHLDLHGDLESYFMAKARLFDARFTQHAVICVDDAWGARLARHARSALSTVVTVASTPKGGDAPDIYAEAVRPTPEGIRFELVDGATRSKVSMRLLGRFNVANAVVAYAVARQLTIAPDVIVEALSGADPVPGRLERVENDRGITVVVDYAHTPDALTIVLANLKELAPATAKLIAVYGCGGDRDRAKRGPMGRAVAHGADVAIVTSDNPRSESPRAIVDEILQGLAPSDPRPIVEIDRRAAIERAVALAVPGDVVVIAGKGHETGQTIGDTEYPFDDRLVAAESLARGGARS